MNAILLGSILIIVSIFSTIRCDEQIQELQVTVTKYAEKCLIRSRNGDTLHM